MSQKNKNQLLSRRDTLRLIGAAGATAVVSVADGNILGRWAAPHLTPVAEAAGTLPGSPGVGHVLNPALFASAPRVSFAVSQLSCVTKPALTEGPFFVDEKLNRSDIRSDPSNNTVKAGVQLKLKFFVSRVTGST